MPQAPQARIIQIKQSRGAIQSALRAITRVPIRFHSSKEQDDAVAAGLTFYCIRPLPRSARSRTFRSSIGNVSTKFDYPVKIIDRVQMHIAVPPRAGILQHNVDQNWTYGNFLFCHYCGFHPGRNVIEVLTGLWFILRLKTTRCLHFYEDLLNKSFWIYSEKCILLKF